MTLGVDYTPCPLITAGYGFQLGKDNQRVHQLQLAVTFHLGLPLAQHLDSHPVGSTHLSLANRLALVRRHSQVILQQRPYGKPVSAGAPEEQASNPQRIPDQDIAESTSWPDMAAQKFNSMLTIKQEELYENIKKGHWDNLNRNNERTTMDQSMTDCVIACQKKYIQYCMDILYEYKDNMNNNKYLEKCNLLKKEYDKLNFLWYKETINRYINNYLTQDNPQKNHWTSIWFVDIALK